MRVFLPGMDGTARLFPPLPEGDRACVLPSEPCSYEALAAQLLPTIPVGATLVAESFSGPLAVLLAEKMRPRKVVLVASFVVSPLPDFLPVVSPTVLRALFTLPPPTPALRALLLERRSPDVLVRAVKTAIGTVPPAVMTQRIRAVMRVDVRAALARVEAPITYLRATRDRLVGHAARDAVVAVRPDTEVVEIEGPHLLLQTRWQQCLPYL